MEPPCVPPVLLGISPAEGETQGMPESNLDEEWFDVVDEKDVVVSRATRQEVHAHGLRHRAVHVLVFNRAGQLFLQKRSPAKTRPREPGIPRPPVMLMPAKITT